MPRREAVAEQGVHLGGTYRREMVSCGKGRCRKCAGGPGHGPYWYRYYRQGGKLVSRYVGKELPVAERDRQAVTPTGGDGKHLVSAPDHVVAESLQPRAGGRPEGSTGGIRGPVRRNRHEDEVSSLTAQIAFLDEEIAVLRRRLADSPRQVRLLEERLRETDANLSSVASQNERLAATLGEARDQIVALKEEVDRLAQPRSGYGVFLNANEDDTCDVFTGGRKKRVNVSPNVELAELRPGQEVVLNEALNVVIVQSHETVGEVVMLKEVLADGKRALVISQADEERVVRLAGPLLHETMRAGDSLLLESRSGYVYERIPKANVELLNKYVGETERHIRLVFQRAREKASEAMPVIEFFDEMDSIFRTRESRSSGPSPTRTARPGARPLGCSTFGRRPARPTGFALSSGAAAQHPPVRQRAPPATAWQVRRVPAGPQDDSYARAASTRGAACADEMIIALSTGFATIRPSLSFSGRLQGDRPC